MYVSGLFYCKRDAHNNGTYIRICSENGFGMAVPFFVRWRTAGTRAHKPDNESGSCAPLSLHFARKNAIMKKKSLPYGSSGATYMENFQKIAVLIDADNTQLTKLEAVLHEVSTY